MIRPLLLAAALTPIAGLAAVGETIAPEAAASAKDFAERLYAAVIADTPPMASDIGNPLAAEAWHSRRLHALFARELERADANGGYCNIDYNPFIPGNDHDFKSVTVTVIAAQGDAAEVAVSMVNFGEPATIPLLLVREDGRWKVDDVRIGATPGFPGTLVSADLARETCQLAE